jgi:2-methylcitrate dehydratase PrpD
MTTTAAVRLAQHFSKLNYRTLPKGSKIALRQLLLDYLGVAIAGSRTESGRIARAYAQSEGGKAEATLIGDTVSVPATQAAFANAISSHSIELDDMDVVPCFHFSPPVFSAALAVAERQNADGKHLLVALAAGCEMMERASRAANPSLRDRCFHTTSACGVFGAAIAAGKLLRLAPTKLVSALGLAGAQVSGILEFHGPMMQKRFSPGPAARGGVTSARMAQLGFTGQDSIFEGQRGFLNAYTDKSDASQLVAGLDEPYQLEFEFKPYACARPIHNAIDCVLNIRRRENPDLGAISRIEVARHPSWVNKHGEKAPKSFHAAQMSLPYSIAVVFKEGQALLKQYSDHKLKDPVLVRLMNMTQITTDASLPRGVSCRMTVTMNDGRKFVSQVDYPKGTIQDPMTDAELQAKFCRLAVPTIGAGHAEQIVDLVSGIDKCSNVRKLMLLTRKFKRFPCGRNK